MTEPLIPGKTEDESRSRHPSSSPPDGKHDERDGGASGFGEARSACQGLIAFGKWGGWGLGALGPLSAAFTVIELAGSETSSLAAWAGAGSRAAAQLLGFTIAGWGLSTASRLAAALAMDCLEQSARASDRLSTQVAEGLVVLDRIAGLMNDVGGPVSSHVPAAVERVRAVAEIIQATEAADWIEAEARLSALEGSFPEDPEILTLRQELASARSATVKESLAQLEAARRANDADRVMEIYQAVRPSLDDQERFALDQDLGKWFLNMIHRRLRVGKVQADVVQLAARFAETFATTVEGASVRASLPTLRRSVGLCPRCAQPYTGLADACPNCKPGTPPLLTVRADEGDDDEPE